MNWSSEFKYALKLIKYKGKQLISVIRAWEIASNNVILGYSRVLAHMDE